MLFVFLKNNYSKLMTNFAMSRENLTLHIRIKDLRSQLDNLGYHYEFSTESVPLLELLVADLLQTTDTLRHYKILSQNTLQACRDLEIYADSYKQENEKLIAEIKRLQSITDTDAGLNEDLSRAKHSRTSETGKRLIKENQCLKEGCSILTENILCDKENSGVNKLRKILQNKLNDRAVLKNVNRNCCENEISELKKQNAEFRNKLEKALLGQQEAKHNAMKISEKYKELENVHKLCKYPAQHTETEFVLSDQKMKKLEEEISKLKEQYGQLDKKGMNDVVNYQRAEKVTSEDFKYVQEILDLKSSYRKLEKTKNEIENEFYELKKVYENIKSVNIELEKDLLEQKRLCQEKEADNDKLEKRLNRNMDEVKTSLNRMNELKIIEHDLNSEIGRLNSIVALQKRHIIALEEKIKELFATKEKKPAVTGLTVYKKPLEPRFRLKRPEVAKKQDKNKPSNIRNTKSTNGNVDSTSTSKTEADQYLSSLSSKYEQEIKNVEIKRVGQIYDKENRILNVTKKYENVDMNDDLIREKSRLLLQIETYKQEIQFLNDKINDLSQKNEHLMSTINQKNAELEEKLLNQNITVDRISSTSNMEDHSNRCIYCSKMEKALTECDSRVCKLEIERAELLAKQRELNATVECNNRHVRQLRTEITDLETELRKEKSDTLTFKTLHEQSKLDAECNANARRHLEIELNAALNKGSELERDRDILRKEICVLESEQKRLQKNMTDTASRKELLLTTVDEKTERLVSLEKLLETRELYVKKLEQSISDMQKKLDLSKSGSAKNEEITRKMTRDIDRLKLRLKETEKNYENVLTDNKRLQNDLTALSQEYAICRNDTQRLNKEASDLRNQVHEYIEKVRIAQETLREKDSERAEMLEHFRTLTREAKQLETNNHSLESEAHSTKTSLQSAENKIYGLEHSLQNKDALLAGYEQQINSLTQNIAHLEITVKDITEEKKQLELNLTSCRELCNQMDNHRDTLSHSVSGLTSARQMLEDKCGQLERKVSHLDEQLSHSKFKISTLEKRLQETESEHENCSGIINELKEEVKGLLARIKCLEESLEKSNRKLRMYHRGNMEFNNDLLNTSSETMFGRSYDYINRNTL